MDSSPNAEVPIGDSTKAPIGNELKTARRRFRSILRLCILVLTINNGHPTLRWERSIRPLKSRNKPLQTSLLKYITTILVRNIEIVAAVAHEPHVSSAADSTFSNPRAYQVNIIATNQPESPLQQGGLASGTYQNDRSKASSLALTAVINPRTVTPPHEPPKYIDPYFENTPPGTDCKIVTGQPHDLGDDGKGTTIWALALKIPSRDPLENHVATIASYIDRVWHNKHAFIASTDMPIFIQYLVARSWEKMERRIHHWSSQGFLSDLVKVDENALRAAVEPAMSLSRNDATLSSKLLCMEDEDFAPIMKNCPNASMRPTITSLLTACQDMQSCPSPEQEVQPEDRSGLYTRDTCFEFHLLLISTLLSYKMELNNLKKAYGDYGKRPNVQNLQVMEDCAQNVYEYGSLLWPIAYSQILQNHLSVLHREGFLRLPVKKEPNLPFDDSDDEASRDDGDGDEGGKIEHEEFLTISNILQSDSKSINNVFLEWIRLQVDRWQAPLKITSFVKRTWTPPTKFTLLAVRHPESMPTNEVMEPWQNTIKDVCTRTRNIHKKYKAAEVIRVLEEQITIGVEQKVHHKIFDKFNSNLPADAPYDSTIHCEAALACVSFCGCVASNDDTLKECLRNVDNSSIAVSKLCCPVCSELLNLLGGPDAFHINGHHHTLFQVELPIWLPLDIVVKLTAKFEKVLGNQIEDMMSNHHKKHAKTPSGQSGDGLSSDSSDDTADGGHYKGRGLMQKLK